MERLTPEQIADMKEYFERSSRVTISSLAMKLSSAGLRLIDTIEAQQQEIDQLRADNARMRDALAQFKYDYEQGENMGGNYHDTCDILRSTPFDYHNPEDVAEIERLKAQVKADKRLIKQLSLDGIDMRLRLSNLTADKDEQAGRLMKMDYLLRRTLPILAVTNDQQGLIEQINELLGGKEDA